MSSFKSTLISYDRYLEYQLFSEMVMPEGIDTDILKDVIMKECGEMQPLWTDPLYMQHSIGVWSHKYVRTFEKWLAAYNAEYNPIHNYDRTETLDETATDELHKTGRETGNTSRNEGIDATTTDALTRNGRVNTSNTLESDRKLTGGYSDTNTRTAYDANNYQPHDQTSRVYNNQNENYSEGGTNTQTDSETSTNRNDFDQTTTETGSVTRNDSEDSVNTNNIQRELRAYGNIGVTTTQQMLEAEYSISKWNIYENIKDLFMQEFCIMIY